jgi:DNA-binding NtrC family response regulator
MKILIIDDQIITQKRLLGYLMMKGHILTIASSMKEAREAVERETFDAAFVNFRALDGKHAEIINVIKEKTPKAEIISMSGAEQSNTFYTAGTNPLTETNFSDKEIVEILYRWTPHNIVSKKPHILIVDDQQELRELLSFILKERYSSASSGSAEDALHYMDEHPVDLALLDYEMPEMDGLTALGKIRLRHPDTAVIMMSGHSSPDIKQIKQKAFDSGAFAFFLKPFDVHRLLEAIDEALQKQKPRGG